MSVQTRDHLIEIIRPQFPDHAEFKTSTDNQVTIFWKLENDHDRPNKRSKIIRLDISTEFVEDYKNCNQNEKTSMDTRFANFVAAKLNDFDPDHDAPYGDGDCEPEETWIVPSL